VVKVVESLELGVVLDFFVGSHRRHLFDCPVTEVAVRNLVLNVKHPAVFEVRGCANLSCEFFKDKAEIKVVLNLQTAYVVVSYDDTESCSHFLESLPVFVLHLTVHFVNGPLCLLTLLALKIVQLSHK